jgi:hypothetical protein
VFLGLDGVVIKSHGGADAAATASAIDLAYAMVHHELLRKIRDTLAIALSELTDGAGSRTALEPGPAALEAARMDEL